MNSALSPMNLNFKQRVTGAFQGAVDTYEEHGEFQRTVADRLARFMINSQNSSPKNISSILEIGCGTGFLTEPLQKAFPNSLYCMTDRASSMAKRCRDKFTSHQQGLSLVMDGELLALDHSWDWIVSSLTMQWFSQFENSLKALWNQTEGLAFSTLVSGSLSEWEQLCQKQNVPHELQKFINSETLEKILRDLAPTSLMLDIRTENQIFDDALSFLRHLKGIGAHTPNSSSQRTPLKSVLQKATAPFTVSYQVAYCILKK